MGSIMWQHGGAYHTSSYEFCIMVPLNPNLVQTPTTSEAQ